MGELKIIGVVSKRDVKRFHECRRKIYVQDSLFISHLDPDVESLFHKNSNPHLAQGQIKRWIAFVDGKVCGRIAAFVTPKATGIGFFDCIDDQELANELFGIAESFLKQLGVLHFQAPINVGERDRYWGLLIEGNQTPSFQENYNFPYYQKLFENYGFEKIFEQTTSELQPSQIDYDLLEKLAQRAERIPGLRVEHIKFNQLRKFVQDFVVVYNRAWGSYSYFEEVTEAEILTLFKKMKPILREDMIWFTYVNDKAVAFYVSALDVNPIFKVFNGRFGWYEKLKFLRLKRRYKFKRTRGLVFGVVPEYQKKAVYAPMMKAMFQAFNEDSDLERIELSWIGDFNPTMHALFKRIGAVPSKLHYTYKK